MEEQKLRPPLSRAERKAAKHEAKVLAAEDARVRAEHRKDPLPDGVKMIHLQGRAAALWVSGAGQLGVRTEREGEWRPLQVRTVRRCWRPWLLRLRLTDGSRMKLRPILPGDAGLADCGTTLGGPIGSGVDTSLGDDPISAVIGMILLVVMLVALPFQAWDNARRVAHVGRLKKVIAVG